MKQIQYKTKTKTNTTSISKNRITKHRIVYNIHQTNIQILSLNKLKNTPMQPQQLVATPIKCYLKLYLPNGLYSSQSHPPINYQILDENTLLRKTNQPTKDNPYQLYPFNRVFSSRISNSLMAQNIRFLDDLYQGINHTMIAMVNQQTYLPFATGVIQHYGLLIELYLALHNDQRINYKSNTTFTLSMFATVHQKPNQFIDLLNGQRYTFLSKKDVDTQSYKTFYEIKICSLQQYLIALKIATIRFKQCCNQHDFFVWRVNLSNQDEFSSQKTISTGNIIICQQNNKNLDTFIKQLSNLVQKSHQSVTNSKVTDHGSLFSCLQSYLRNGKLSFIQCLMNDYDDIQTHLEQIKNIPAAFMNKSTQYKINYQPIQLKHFINQTEQQIQTQSSTMLKKVTTYMSSLSMKEIQKIKQLHCSFKTFIRQTTDKLNSFIKLYKNCQQVRQEFYQREKFPVGIQIKDLDDIPFTIKTFYIAKIYSLSQKFQMQNLQTICQKMMTIKNQIEISLKTLLALIAKNSQKLYNTDSFSLGKSYAFIATPKKKNRQKNNECKNESQPSTAKYEKVLKQLKEYLEKVKKHLKYILNLSPRYINEQNIRKQKSQPKFHSINSSSLDLIDFSKLLGQDLFNDIEKHMKTLSNSKKYSKRENSSLTKIQNQDIESINEKYETKERSQKSEKKTVLFRQRQKKSVTYAESQEGDKSILDISAIQTGRMKRAKRILRQHQSLQKSLMDIKKSQIQKHLQIRQGINQFQKSKFQPLDKEIIQKQLFKKDQIQKAADKLKTLCLVKKSSKALMKKINLEKQNGQVPRKDNHDYTQIVKRKERQMRSETINTTISRQYSQASLIKKQHHSRYESNPVSLHVQPQRMRKNHSIVRLNNSIHNQSVFFPELSKSAQKTLNVSNINQSFNSINNKASPPKLKKKHLIKIVKNSLHDQIPTKNDQASIQNNRNSQSKSFLPGLSLVCKKILC